MAARRLPSPIQTARLVLGPYSSGDVDALHALFVDSDVRRYMWDDRVVARERVAGMCGESTAGFAAGRFGLFTVRAKVDSSLIGVTGFWPFDEQRGPELLYALAPALWGRGYAQEMAAPMLDFGADVLGLDPIWAVMDRPNRASATLALRLGMRADADSNREEPKRLHYRLDR